MSPGNEQRNFWSSTAAQSAGSRNYAGIAELSERQIAALDRILLWSHYVIPDSLLEQIRAAAKASPQWLGFPDTWWWDAEKAVRLEAK